MKIRSWDRESRLFGWKEKLPKREKRKQKEKSKMGEEK